ncbi:MAG TPA: ABC transporter substrate-binding protein [Candidatus Limnocylindrales bacterium]|nr:ABC transporter substrate-binding protein [Candidatus Limnocylindrales bacterium]
MRFASNRPGRIAVAMAVVALVAAACGGGTPAPSGAVTPTATPAGSSAATGPIAVCELAYVTGDFASYGPALSADVVFPVKKVINADPPLGRQWVSYKEDLGTVGEAQAARTCLDKDKADILVSIAHGYGTYRDFMMEYWQEHDAPLGPSIHGGLIPGNLGGKGAEPIFRAQGMDEGLGVYADLYAQSIGAKTAVIFATQIEGFQIAANAAEKAAPLLGLQVLARLNEQASLKSYAAVAQKISQLKPDVVIVQAGSVESSVLIKQATEAGLSLNWIGETGWNQAEFIKSIKTSKALATQKSIGIAAFSANTTTPAWTFYQPLRDAWIQESGVDPTAYYGADNPYAFSAYDVLVQTALAVEMAGSYKASLWAPAMFKVGAAPGDKCYTYKDCLALIRQGKDIDYDGVTGPATYTTGGVNAVTPTYLGFKADGTTAAPVLLDSQKALDTLDQIKTTAKCDKPDPPNKCTWG